MTASPQTLAAVRVALAQPFADPVNVGGIPMRRAEARALERALSTKSELPGRVPLSSGQRGAGVAPARTANLSNARPSVREDGCAEGSTLLSPDALGAFDHAFHDAGDTHVRQ